MREEIGEPLESEDIAEAILYTVAWPGARGRQRGARAPGGPAAVRFAR